MEPKFQLPSPNFNKHLNEPSKSNVHYLTPSGMTLLSRGKQPPPMYGARGSTVPGKFLKVEHQQNVRITTVKPSKSQSQPEFCANCKLELATVQDMRRHLSQHETCPAENCSFDALPSILDQHVEAKHVTGLYKTIKKIWTPETIAAWRAERCKRFPTVANAELAKQAKEQRLKRGERLEASKRRFGQAEDRRRTRPNRKNCPKQNNRQGNRGKPSVTPAQSETIKKKTPTTESPIPKELADQRPTHSPMFAGTSKMVDYKHVKSKKEANALSKMLGMYGTDSENEDSTSDRENNEQLDGTPGPCLKNESNMDRLEEKLTGTSLESSLVPCKENIETEVAINESSSADEGPEEVPITRKTETILSPAVEAKSPPLKPKTAVQDNKSIPVKRPIKRKLQSGLNFKRARQINYHNTMLSKLLAPDIRHERNVLLQCVRYVCEKNFFNIGNRSNQVNNINDIQM